MRTLVLVGIAAVAAVAADKAHANPPSDNTTTRVERRVILVDRVSEGDALVYRDRADRTLDDGNYRGRWEGQWQGAWEEGPTPRYRGTYEGVYEGAPQSPHRGREIAYSNEELERLCRRDNGVGGAAIGAVAGGVVGNRVAGRGNRTAGTVIGAVGGAVAGAVIDRAEDANRLRACETYWAHTDRGAAYAPPPGYAYGYGYPGYEGYYGYGAGYYVAGAPVIVEETETTYETVAVAAPVRARVAARPRARARVAPRPRVVAPRPRTTCTCR